MISSRYMNGCEIFLFKKENNCLWDFIKVLFSWNIQLLIKISLIIKDSEKNLDTPYYFEDKKKTFCFDVDVEESKFSRITDSNFKRQKWIYVIFFSSY